MRPALAITRLPDTRAARQAVTLLSLALLIFVMALAAHRLFAGMTTVGMIGDDTFEYWKDANALLHGQRDYLSDRATFDALNALALNILGVNDYAIRAFIAGFAIANIALVYVLALLIARNALVALAAAGLYAFNPTLLFYAATELPHVTGATFVLVAGLAATFAMRAAASPRARLTAIFVVGAAIAGAVLTHEDLLFLAAGYAIVAVLPFAVPGDRPLVPGGRSRTMAVALAALLLGAAAGAAWPMFATGFGPAKILHDAMALHSTLDANSTVRVAGDAGIVPMRFLRNITVDTFGRTITALAAGFAVLVPVAFVRTRDPALRPLFTLEIPVLTYVAGFLLVLPIYLEGGYKRLIVPLAALIIVFALSGAYLLSKRFIGSLAAILLAAWASYVVIGGKPWEFAPAPLSPHRQVYDAVKDRVTSERKLLLPACYWMYKPWVGLGSPVYLGDNVVPIYLMDEFVDFDTLIAAKHVGYVYVAIEPFPGIWPRDQIERLFSVTYGVTPDRAMLERIPRVSQDIWRNDTRAQWSPEACAFEARVMRRLLDRRGARVALTIPGLADIYELPAATAHPPGK